MKITVIGTGYVGLVAGLGFADFGNKVVCLDSDEDKLGVLNSGRCPIYEPGTEVLLERNLAAERIKFTNDRKLAIEHGEIIFICVGTPQTQDGEVNLESVYEVAHDIGKYITGYKVVVNKSTVPVGTARKVKTIIEEEVQARGASFDFDVASNPEFLREGRAVSDFTNPDRIVIGTDNEKSKKILQSAYGAFARSNKPIITTTIETAEMIKYANNAFLATKITFINEIANLCEKVGANALEVAAAMGKDGRISPKFLHPGPGYGGSCFPKDTRAIASLGKKHGANLTLIEAVIEANEKQKHLAAEKIINRFPDGGKIAILGLAFKPDTDDVREAPALEIINKLILEGKYELRLYDPQAMIEFKKQLQLKTDADSATWCNSAYQACEDSDAVVIITEWFEFRNMDLEYIKSMLRTPVIFDFRNIYSKVELEKLGFEYFGTGV